jgi:hypothetical protein
MTEAMHIHTVSDNIKYTNTYFTELQRRLLTTNLSTRISHSYHLYKYVPQLSKQLTNQLTND